MIRPGAALLVAHWGLGVQAHPQLAVRAGDHPVRQADVDRPVLVLDGAAGAEGRAPDPATTLPVGVSIRVLIRIVPSCRPWLTWWGDWSLVSCCRSRCPSRTPPGRSSPRPWPATALAVIGSVSCTDPHVATIWLVRRALRPGAGRARRRRSSVSARTGDNGRGRRGYELSGSSPHWPGLSTHCARCSTSCGGGQRRGGPRLSGPNAPNAPSSTLLDCPLRRHQEESLAHQADPALR